MQKDVWTRLFERVSWRGLAVGPSFYLEARVECVLLAISPWSCRGHQMGELDPNFRLQVSL